jgi:DNA processing protein
VRDLLQLTALDPRYPSRLRRLRHAPACITVGGGALEAEHTVAVVGSRDAREEAAAWAGVLARRLVAEGVVVVSGGALGIDGAAHRATLEAGGRTWVVAGTGCDRLFPSAHRRLFEAIERGPGAMIWPFAPPIPARPQTFTYRNRILVALSDAVVVVQAGLRSGALHAAGVARRLGKPLWVVPAPPWLTKGYEGSWQLLEEGVRPLTRLELFLQSLALGSPAAPSRPLSDVESAVMAVTSTAALHLDHLAERAHLSAQATATALLTLSLENVVVEGPPGFFRRRDAHKR